ncbi:MAG: glycosyltransferase family 39 protein, partial [Candidatus Eisenbacteria bacterium]|nr:glycosyltransferase family 39 protein [Candidatus Eisenbacteria bacterium]
MTERARTTERTQTGIERDGEHRWERSDTIWSLALALIATVTAAVLSSTVFGRIPHVQDSIAQLFQARIFAGGHLTAPAPALPEFFAYHHMILADGRWYSQYPPGHALSLLIGVVLHAPWLVNPVLGGVAVFATYFLGMETLGRPAARLGASLALVSPFLLLMSAEFMAHATTLATLTLFLALQLQALRTGSRFAAWASALLLAWGVLARPYSALGFTIPVAILALWNLRKGAPARQTLVALGVGGVLGGALLLAYNAGTTGDPFLFGYEKLY